MSFLNTTSLRPAIAGFLVLLLALVSSASNAQVLQNSEVCDSKHVVLVAGAAHGAWCWYKVTTLLRKKGFRVSAIDLASQGRDESSADNILSLGQYAKPLTDFLANNVTVNCKVFLVGHSLGGISLSYAMEMHADKIEKAVFVSAVMPLNNQSVATNFPTSTVPSILISASPVFTNGPLAPPTSIVFNLTSAPILFYNESPEQDITLALSLLRPSPYSVFSEVLNLTPENYGSVPRYYIQTAKDNNLLPALQDYIVKSNLPEQVFVLQDGDHSPFFSDVRNLLHTLQQIFSL